MAATEVSVGAGLSTEYLDCVRESVLSTFSMFWEIEASVPTEQNGTIAGEGIIGVLSLVGGVSWTMMMAFSRDTAIALVPKFAGFDIPYDSDDMGDVIGELVNVLAGDLSARLDEKGLEANLSLPTVTRGTDMRLLAQDGHCASIFGFHTPDGDFSLTIVAGR